MKLQLFKIARCELSLSVWLSGALAGNRYQTQCGCEEFTQDMPADTYMRHPSIRFNRDARSVWSGLLILYCGRCFILYHRFF
ncbi:hypothetical protein NDU88_008299, partial [Pleurodeles waltl]